MRLPEEWKTLVFRTLGSQPLRARSFCCFRTGFRVPRLVGAWHQALVRALTRWGDANDVGRIRRIRLVHVLMVGGLREIHRRRRGLVERTFVRLSVGDVRNGAQGKCRVRTRMRPRCGRGCTGSIRKAGRAPVPTAGIRVSATSTTGWSSCICRSMRIVYCARISTSTIV